VKNDAASTFQLRRIEELPPFFDDFAGFARMVRTYTIESLGRIHRSVGTAVRNIYLS
jgi:hypothetical protein